mmetsp:Transcript_10169/g.13440  ORF Transcript_10169/g.13440 Transcript_10169/m.13440 type:complete len:441 (+) Transcript_10169:67-1389(+)
MRASTRWIRTPRLSHFFLIIMVALKLSKSTLAFSHLSLHPKIHLSRFPSSPSNCEIRKYVSRSRIRPKSHAGLSVEDNSSPERRKSKILRRLADVQNPAAQVCVVLAFYTLHLTQLTQRQVVFPVQLIPNEMCHFTGLGLDSLAGIISIAIYRFIRLHRNKHRSDKVEALPPILSSPKLDETPWRLPTGNVRNRLTGLLAAFLLVQTYFVTGRFSLFWEDMLYNMSAMGFPITSPMFRSLVVLLGHLTWLTAGTLILRWLPRPPKFFGDTNSEVEPSDKLRWFRSSFKTKWLWWVIGGFFVSSCLFNLADLLNQYILPQSVLDDVQESVVSQLVNPEHNDIFASAAGYIAPCMTAPWWEEILYRGFALPLLTQLVGYPWAVFLQGVIFSAHHMSLTAALPLAVLGWTWAIIYTKSRNLLTVIVIHSLWNSRVFLGGWLGL